MKQIIFTLAILLGFTSSQYAQCDDISINLIDGAGFQVNTTPPFIPRSVGQTFTSCRDLPIESIVIRPNSNNLVTGDNFTLNVGIEPGSGEDLIPLSTSTFEIPTLGAMTITIPLTSPLPTVSGEVYRFTITNPVIGGRLTLGASNPGDYSEGTLVGINRNYSPNVDLDFQVNYGEPSAESIPTLSQWMLFILGLVIASYAVVLIYRNVTKREFS